ncbi:MAG: hypothetical protein ACJ07L_17955 [Opitutales bacterium]
MSIKSVQNNQALAKDFSKIEDNEIISSWKDTYASSGISSHISDFVQVPTFGCFKDQRKMHFQNNEKCIEKTWSTGGETGGIMETGFGS